MFVSCVFFFKQKTAYEMRISDWSSDVCSSDLELLDLVWGHRHVTPGVLTRAIAQLRHALEDDSHNPRYIQTQHAMGYRFIGVLETGNGPADIPAGPAPGGEAEPLPASPAPDLAQVPDPEHERQPAHADRTSVG